jgi:hypothetical protein
MSSPSPAGTALLLRRPGFTAHLAGGAGGVIVLLVVGFVAAVAFNREAAALRLRD